MKLLKPHAPFLAGLMLLQFQLYKPAVLLKASALKTVRCYYWSGVRGRASPGDANSSKIEHMCCHIPFPGLLSTAQGPRALRNVDSTAWSRSNTFNETKVGSCLFHEEGSLLAKCKHKPWALHVLGEKKKGKKQFTDCRCLLMPFKMF